MEKEQILLGLQKIFQKEKILINEPMKKHTSFKIGGTADFFVNIQNLEELESLLKFVKDENIPFYIIGNGSNLLVTDNGIRGIVAKIQINGIQIENINNNKIIEKKQNEDIKNNLEKSEEETTNKIQVTVKSGTPIGFLAQKLCREEIAGFEELAGIPGTIGGAIVMNAGAHGKEMKDVVKEITAINYEGKICNFSNKEAEFAYRKSKFSNGQYIIIEVKLELQKGNKEKIKEKMEEYSKYRKEKQPLEYPSAGSTFKRGEDFITAQLIDKAGLKGFQIGGAQVSEKHAGFIINKENATAEDVMKLIQAIKEKVYKKYGKKIELEVKMLGN